MMDPAELSPEEEALVCAAIQEELDALRKEFLYAAILLNDDPIPSRLH